MSEKLTPAIRKLIRQQLNTQLEVYGWDPAEFSGHVVYGRHRISAVCELYNAERGFTLDFVDIYFNKDGITQSVGPFVDGLCLRLFLRHF